MRKVYPLVIFCFYTILSFAQTDAIDSYFTEYTDNDDFTSIFISQKMLGLISNISVEEEEGQDLVDVVKDLSGLRILTTDNPPANFFNNAIKTLSQNKFDELMSVKENDQLVKFMVLEGTGDDIKELVLLTSDETGVVLISFMGDLDLNKIAKLSKSLDIDGAEHLEKLKERN